jgi:replicative DNA helicase
MFSSCDMSIRERQAAVGLFSLEMSGEQLSQRVLAEQSSISSDPMRKGQVQPGDFHRFAEITQQHTGVPFYIESTSDLSIDGVRAQARRLKHQYGIGLLIIDYLQLLHGTDSLQARQNRTVEVSEITRGLKAVAKNLNIPVLALSQLSRDVEKREDKRPQRINARSWRICAIRARSSRMPTWSASCTARNITEAAMSRGSGEKRGTRRSWSGMPAGRTA